MLAPTPTLRDRIFDEIQSRIQETDDVGAGARRPVGVLHAHGRGPAVRDPLPAAARRGADATSRSCSTRTRSPADTTTSRSAASRSRPTTASLAYSVDINGGERYTLRFRDLDTGADLADVVDDVTYGLAWADDARTCFYVRPDDAMRPYRCGGTRSAPPPRDDVLVFQRRRRAVLRRRRPHAQRPLRADRRPRRRLTSEAWFVPTDDAGREPPRRRAARARARVLGRAPLDDAHGDRFLIVTNAGGAPQLQARRRAGRRSRAASTGPSSSRTATTCASTRVDAFRDHLVLTERADGLDRLRVHRVADDARHEIALPDPVYSVWVGPNAEYDTRDAALRLHVARRAGHRPRLRPGRRARATVVKTQPVLGGYDAVRVHVGAAVGDAPRRRRGSRSRSCTARDVAARRHRARAALRLRRRTRSRATRRSARRGCRCSTAASCSRSRTSAAAASWAGAGTSTAGSSTRRNTFTDFVACAEALVAERLHVARPARRARRERGRLAHGRGREPAARPVRGDRRRGAVRRRRHDDARRRRCRSRSPSGRSGATRAKPTRTRG